MKQEETPTFNFVVVELHLILYFHYPVLIHDVVFPNDFLPGFPSYYISLSTETEKW